MNKIILFDFDGTIADSLVFFLKEINKLAEKYNFQKVDKENIDRLRGSSPKNIIKELGIPLMKIPFIARDMKQTFHKDIQQVNPIQGIKEALLRLKATGYTLGILTSNSKENVEAFLKKHTFEIFDYKYSDSSLFGKDKTFKNFLKKNGLGKENIVYVGDEIRDIQACQKVGIPIIAVAWGLNSEEGLRKHNPDFLIHEPQELVKVLAS